MTGISNIVYKPCLPETEIPVMKSILSKLSLQKIDEDYSLFRTLCHNIPNIENNIGSLVGNLFNTEYGQINFKYARELTDNDPTTGRRESKYLFRVRKATLIPEEGNDNGTEDDNEIFSGLLFNEMSCENDMWMKPCPDITHYDRLNKPGQQMLYTSLQASTTILETRRKIGDHFFWIVYERTSPVSYFSDCVRFVAHNELTEEENMKRYIIFNHLRNEFTRVFPAGYDEQSQYCISSAIAEHFFMGDGVCGIQYPSVRGLGHNNFAFFGDKAKECLTPICVKFMCIDKNSAAQEIANGFWEDDKFIWTPPYSNLSKVRLRDSIGVGLFHFK